MQTVLKPPQSSSRPCTTITTNLYELTEMVQQAVGPV